jgi:hypothetical protein
MIDIINIISTHTNGNAYQIGAFIHMIAGLLFVFAVVVWDTMDIIANVCFISSVIVCMCSALAYGTINTWIWIVIFTLNTIKVGLLGFILAYHIRIVLRHILIPSSKREGIRCAKY